ncbi:MICOS complex subunit MIC10-like [Leguminivora glycinivorella]|uniref:MICOS complex subunit MIC10-like n=1 Tax=Leguminivora glycinivorella TaxID=1035111 RepID=UPI0020104129|nr:MICOS complex subunit MIC10-like [Leguminivora glycinivorella]
MAKGKEPVDEFSAKLDMCLTDGVVKTGGGLVLGSLASLLFLGRRKWPILTGIGMGMGIAYANCEFQLNPKKSTS